MFLEDKYGLRIGFSLHSVFHPSLSLAVPSPRCAPTATCTAAKASSGASASATSWRRPWTSATLWSRAGASLSTSEWRFGGYLWPLLQFTGLRIDENFSGIRNYSSFLKLSRLSTTTPMPSTGATSSTGSARRAHRVWYLRTRLYWGCPDPTPGGALCTLPTSQTTTYSRWEKRDKSSYWFDFINILLFVVGKCFVCLIHIIECV